MLYHVTFARAWEPYARGFLVLQILLNLVGFCSFWLPPHAGERMGISVTALLASVASELVVTERLPAFGELSWVSGFSLSSLLFTALALGENCAVIYYHYHTGSTITPRFVTWMRQKLKEMLEASKKQKVPPNPDPTVSMVSFRNEGPRRGFISPEIMSESADNDESQSQVNFEDDEDDDDDVKIQEACRKLSNHTSDKSDYSRRRQPVVGQDADDFKNLREMQNNEKWQRVAALIDEVSRVVFPVAYAIFLGITFTRAGV